MIWWFWLLNISKMFSHLKNYHLNHLFSSIGEAMRKYMSQEAADRNVYTIRDIVQTL
jgi:hypothetical protein